MIGTVGSVRAARSDERLRGVIDRLADGVMIVGRDGVVRFANPAAEALFGRPAEELVGGELGFPTLAGETTEIDVVRRGGGTAAAELRAVETDWEGEPAFIVSLRDVTDRREAEERRRQAEADQAARRHAEAEARRARFLSNVSSVLSGSLDYHATLSTLARLAVPELADWCVIDVAEEDGRMARVAAAHSDGDREPLLAVLCEDFPPRRDGGSVATQAARGRAPVYVPHVTDPWLEAVTTGPEHAALVRALGIRSLIAVPLVARTETLGVATLVCADRVYSRNDLATAEDFAQRAALSISNARLYAAAQQASRAKSEFLAVMSHELRTPLNAVMGYADLLQAGIGGEVSDRQRSYLDRIKDGARHLEGIIDEILAFSRMEAGHEEVRTRRVDLRDVLRQVGDLLRPVARQKGLGFDLRLPPEAAIAETDPEKVMQILRNLGTNAVKFTDEGEVRIEGVRGGTHHLVRVVDTGIGIRREHRERIFEPFWQVEQSNRREVGGTGLGLSVARRLAELLGGRLSLESTTNHGTTFTLALPAADHPENGGGASS
ncbi:ATP-binding protein [Longimicrobium sp.]|uniref:ATP-binding protein n=1 Tax=Longimicrobium sp. TaxID=2029185 RepID=UPI002B55EF6C|nr:ATP-binding protein [Longimicrobium sp.]HSU14179.1 ATP-binding protein [Longimicrobium sp.]